MRSDLNYVITSEVCEDCQHVQYFTLNDLARVMSRASIVDGRLSYEGYWNCDSCNLDNSCVAEVEL